MASTCGWTLEYIYDVSMEEMTYLLEGSQKLGKRQEAEIKKHTNSSSRPGKVSIGSLDQLRNLPGVKTMRKR